MNVNRNLVSFQTLDVNTAGPGFLTPVVTVSGPVASLKMGEAVAAGDFLYYSEADKEFKKADSDAAATMPVVAYALETGANGAYSKALLPGGYIRSNALRDLNRASGTITISGDVSDADYLTIGGVKFSFETAGDAPSGAVKIDASAGAGKAAMQAALLVAMAANSTVTAQLTWGAFETDVLTVYAKCPLYKGDLGNAITLVKDGSNLAVSGATLTGGIDGGVVYSSGTAGGVTFTKPSGVSDVVQKLGIGVSDDEMYFWPELETVAAPWNRLEADAATVTITEAYDGKVLLLDKTDGCTINLPAASTVLGMQFEVIVMATLTTPATINAVIATDDIMGAIIAGNDDNTGVVRWVAGAADNKISLGATTGGLVASHLKLTAVASGEWYVQGEVDASGTEATPFSTAT